MERRYDLVRKAGISRNKFVAIREASVIARKETQENKKIESVVQPLWHFVSLSIVQLDV